jgi:hypothetical protein
VGLAPISDVDVSDRLYSARDSGSCKPAARPGGLENRIAFENAAVEGGYAPTNADPPRHTVQLPKLVTCSWDRRL